jgi:hypothetical protein
LLFFAFLCVILCVILPGLARTSTSKQEVKKKRRKEGNKDYSKIVTNKYKFNRTRKNTASTSGERCDREQAAHCRERQVSERVCNRSKVQQAMMDNPLQQRPRNLLWRRLVIDQALICLEWNISRVVDLTTLNETIRLPVLRQQLSQDLALLRSRLGRVDGNICLCAELQLHPALRHGQGLQLQLDLQLRCSRPLRLSSTALPSAQLWIADNLRGRSVFFSAWLICDNIMVITKLCHARCSKYFALPIKYPTWASNNL